MVLALNVGSTAEKQHPSQASVEDHAAGIAAHVLRRWKEPKHRKWFGACMRIAAEMIESNLETRIPLLELPRTTVRRLKEKQAD